MSPQGSSPIEIVVNLCKQVSMLGTQVPQALRFETDYARVHRRFMIVRTPQKARGKSGLEIENGGMTYEQRRQLSTLARRIY